MIPQVCGSPFLKRSDTNGIRISSTQPVAVIFAAESQKKSGDEFSPDASSLIASYCTLRAETRNSAAVRSEFMESTKTPAKSSLVPLSESWSPYGARMPFGSASVRSNAT